MISIGLGTRDVDFEMGCVGLFQLYSIIYVHTSCACSITQITTFTDSL